MLNVGETIDGRYKIAAVLGEGGMGRVYLVEDSRLDSRWVLKEFNFSGSNDQERVALEEHFQTEAKLCARLSHPGIPKVIDYFTRGSNHYLVEEYVEGETLLAAIGKRKFQQEEIVRIALDLCRVLEYIHSEGIVYRDLKPDNVMFKPDGSLKLIDFGIARVYKAGKGQDTVIIGTPGFAAPEQYGASQTDARSDIYSLGALLHHLSTGIDPRNKPFDFDPPSKLGIDVDPKFEGAVMKSLSLKPDERYAAVSLMRAELEEAARDLTIRSSATQGVASGALPNNLTPAGLLAMVGTTSGTATKGKTGGGKAAAGGKSADSPPGNWIIILIYAVVFCLLFVVLLEIKFEFWILIPYVLAAWLIVYFVSKLLKKR